MIAVLRSPADRSPASSSLMWLVPGLRFLRMTQQRVQQRTAFTWKRLLAAAASFLISSTFL